MCPFHVAIIKQFSLHPNDNGFLQYSQREMTWVDRVKNEDVLHKERKKYPTRNKKKED